MTLNESTVEVAAIEWFGELGSAVEHGPHSRIESRTLVTLRDTPLPQLLSGELSVARSQSN